jgi:hypothetical protein
MKFTQKIKSFLLAALLISGALVTTQIISPALTHAQFSNLDKIGEAAGLPTEKNFLPRGVTASSDAGINHLEGIILTVVDLVKYFIYSIAIFLALFQGFKLIVAGKDIDSFQEEAKKNAKYSIMAILIVFIADQAIRRFFFPDSGAIFENSGANIELYSQEGIAQIRSLSRIAEYVASAFAMVVLIISGVGMALSSGSEETFKKHQTRILWALAGLLIVGIAEFVILDVIFPEAGTVLPNIGKGMLLLKKFINFMAGFISTIAFLIILYGGYLYVFGGIAEDNLAKAKKAFVAGVAGIILAAAAFGVTSSLIKTESGGGKIAAPLEVPRAALPDSALQKQ